jgi:hypothetical protein
MRSSMWTRIVVTAVTLCAVAALASPASALTLRRDGSKAVPFVEDLRPGLSKLTLRRDGSKAVPFVEDLRPGLSRRSSEPSIGSPADGFDWGDAAIGAGLGGVAVLFVVAGTTAMRDGRKLPGALRPGSGAASG